MPVTNIKNIASRLIIKYLLINLVLLIGINAQAAGTCLSDKSDIHDDAQKIAEKLFTKYGCNPLVNCKNVSAQKSNLSKIYDSIELKVDRSLPFLNLINAIGIYTDKPNNTPLFLDQPL